MTEEQAEKIFRELRWIRMGIWTAILLAAFIFASQEIMKAIIGPPPPVNVQLPK